VNVASTVLRKGFKGASIPCGVHRFRVECIDSVWSAFVRITDNRREYNSEVARDSSFRRRGDDHGDVRYHEWAMLLPPAQ